MSSPLREVLHRWQAGLLGLLLMAGWLVNEHYPPWTGFYSESLAVLGGAVVIVVALLLSWNSSLRPLPLLLMACAAIPWAQWAAGLVLFHGDAALASLYLVGTALCLWAGGAAAPTERAGLTRTLALTLLTLSVLSTLIAAYQWLGLSGLGLWINAFPQGLRPGANVGQPNHLATLVCTGLAALVLLHARRQLPPLIGVLLFIVLVAGLALTQSRIPWVIAVVLGAWMVARRDALAQPLRVHPAVLLVGMAVYVLVFWGSVHASTAMLDAPVLADSSRLEVGRRPLLWAQWIHAIRLAPWEGYGWLQGTLAQAAAAIAKPGLEYSFYAHNLVLDMLVWNGLPLGLPIVLALLGWYGLVGLRASGPEQWFRFAVVTAFAVHAMLEYPHAYGYFLVPVGLLAGQLEAEAGAFPRALRVPPALLWLLALVTLGGAVVVMRDYVRIEADTRLLRGQLLRIGGLRHSDPPADILLLDQMLAPLQAGRLAVRKGMSAEDIALLARTTRRFPTRFHVQQLALALALNGRQPEADLHMRRLRATIGRSDYATLLIALRLKVSQEHPELMPLAETWASWADAP